MRRPTIFVGERFGLLTVTGRDATDPHMVICRCDCGGRKVVWSSNLTRSLTTSCGCQAGTHRAFLRIPGCALADHWRTNAA